MDGREALRQDLPDKDAANHPRAGEYATDVVVAIPAGAHRVQVDNAGADWFAIDRYGFRGMR